MAVPYCISQLILQAFESIPPSPEGLSAETIVKEITSKYLNVPQDLEKDLPHYLTQLNNDGVLVLCLPGLEGPHYSLATPRVKAPDVKPDEAAGDKEQVVGGLQGRDEAVNDGEKDQEASNHHVKQALQSIPPGPEGLPAETIFKETTSKYLDVPQDLEKDLPHGVLVLCLPALEGPHSSLATPSVKTPGVKPNEAVGDKEQVVRGPQGRDEQQRNQEEKAQANDGKKDQEASAGKHREEHMLSVVEKKHGQGGKTFTGTGREHSIGDRYKDMIIGAIKCLPQSQDGLSQNLISSYIESNYYLGDVPEYFPRILASQLDLLVQEEVLTMNVVGVEQELHYKFYQRPHKFHQRPPKCMLRPKDMPPRVDMREGYGDTGLAKEESDLNVAAGDEELIVEDSDTAESCS